jgi:hypothetical protein
MTRIIIENDAQNLVSTAEGVIYRDIKCFDNLNFESFSFIYSPRVCNKVAHKLVVLGASSQEASLDGCSTQRCHGAGGQRYC